MTISPVPLTATGTQRYFINEVGQWIGHGAESLGLIGDARANGFDFGCALRGYSPFGGLLVATREGTEHRAGWQVGYSAPKSISIQALVRGDERLIPAHAAAAEAAFYHMERYAMVSHHGQYSTITGKLVAASFQHTLARPVGLQLPDPQVHTHVVLMNMTQRPDGEWRALDKYQIFRHSQQGTNVYREEMQYRVKQLGYDIKTTSAKGEWELAGYDRLHIRAFSQRKEQIEQIISAHGWHPHAANLASVIDRRARGTFDMNYLKQQWKERDLQLGIGLTPTPTYEHDGSPKVGSFEDDDYKYGRSREYGQSRGMGH